jgi:hypothetical protein
VERLASEVQKGGRVLADGVEKSRSLGLRVGFADDVNGLIFEVPEVS